MARGAVIAGIALIAIGGGALGLGLLRKPVLDGGMSPEMTAAVGTAATSIDNDLKRARKLVEERTGAIAKVDKVASSVAADAATAMDMAKAELAFRPEPSEVIELGQLPKSGAAVSLLVLPVGASPSPRSGKVGMFTDLDIDQVTITQTTTVTPADVDTAKLLDGYVSVSRTLSLKSTLDKLAATGVSGKLVIGDNDVAFGAPTTGSLEATPIPSQEGAQLMIASAPVVKVGMPVAVVGGGAGVAGLGLILLLIGLIGGKDKTSTGTTQVPGSYLGATQVSGNQSVATGASQGFDPNGSINSGAVGPGTMIGRWEVVRRLGSGGMADVYLARARGEAGFEKLVALKVMHGHLARNQRAVDHFLDEARLAARVHHPNVVAIQDLGKIGNDYAIVMEYVEGVDLERLLAAARMGSRQVPVNVGLGILCRICDGLHAAHTATAPDGSALGIIHRDVKSANVLVSKQGGVKVVDFGIAKAAQQGHLTVAGETKGTPSMMAPEQRIGEQVDVRADVYSVGAVAFEVLTGHAVNLDLAALAHLGVENWPHLPPPSQLRPELPQELDAILLGAMSYERAKRPADCATFEATLEAVMKRNNLSASDKDIARWAESELREVPQLQEAGPAAT